MRNLLLIAVCFAFAALGIFIIIRGGHNFAGWYSIVFFGLGGLFVLGLIVKERITRKPFLIITKESVMMNGLKSWEIPFRDVESFFLTSSSKAQMIGIKYKADVEVQKMNDSSNLGRKVRRINDKLAGTQEAIPADGLSLKPQQLCDLLNERLK